jgi:hypothetical protein
MNFVPAGPASLAAFVAILVSVIGALLWAVHRAYRTPKSVGIAAIVIAVWLGAQAALVASGRMTSLPLNGLPLFFAPIILIGLGAGLSPVGGKIATGVPLAALVGFQAFRLPLELVLHTWAAQGTIPSTMTWTGLNWDIVSGTVALIAAPLAGRHPQAARVANVVGFALLLNVMRVALLSSPLPFGWGQQPPLLLALHLPYAFIGPVCVGGALFGHVVLTRAVFARQPAR